MDAYYQCNQHKFARFTKVNWFKESARDCCDIRSFVACLNPLSLEVKTHAPANHRLEQQFFCSVFEVQSFLVPF